MYKVLEMFTDLQDDNHLYQVGDVYPRLGLSPSEERINELSGPNNKRGIPLIEKIKEVKKKTKNKRS